MSDNENKVNNYIRVHIWFCMKTVQARSVIAGFTIKSYHLPKDVYDKKLSEWQ